jgi:hypothetical protein
MKKRKYFHFHNCLKCNQCKTDKLPCQPCIKAEYNKEYKNWKCGNENIEKLVKYVRPSLVNTILFLEWIPYEKLTDIKYLNEGGYGTISLATWVDGYVVRWNHKKKKWHRKGKMKVVLKTMKRSNKIRDDFLVEVLYFRVTHLFGWTFN